VQTTTAASFSALFNMKEGKDAILLETVGTHDEVY
jgi:hypothetical protein